MAYVADCRTAEDLMGLPCDRTAGERERGWCCLCLRGFMFSRDVLTAHRCVPAQTVTYFLLFSQTLSPIVRLSLFSFLVFSPLRLDASGLHKCLPFSKSSVFDKVLDLVETFRGIRFGAFAMLRLDPIHICQCHFHVVLKSVHNFSNNSLHSRAITTF